MQKRHKFVVFAGNYPHLLKNALLARGNWEELDTSYLDLASVDIVWKPVNLPTRNYAALDQDLKRNPNKITLLNHFQNNRIITCKHHLLKQLRLYYSLGQASQTGYSTYDTTPTSFIITSGIQDKEYLQFIKRVHDLQRGYYLREKIPAKHLTNNIWILKPVNLNQGRGIEIHRGLKQIMASINSKPFQSNWVVQKYLERPLLYENRKFDIRVWVLLTPKRQLYFYRQCYMRLTSAQYQTTRLTAQTHLTNNMLQRSYSSYSKFEQGNVLPLQKLQEYLPIFDAKYKDFKLDMIIDRMYDLTIDVFVSSNKSIAFCSKKMEFQLFGIDFLVDQDIRTYLIEVNVNPCLAMPNPFLQQLVPRMVDDMFKIIADPIFPPSQHSSENNNFKLIYSQNSFNLRRPFKSGIYPLPELTPPPNKGIEQERRTIKQMSLQEIIGGLLDSAIYIDYEPFYCPVIRLVNKLACYQVQSDKQMNSYCNLLLQLAKSRFSGILFDQKIQTVLLNILQGFETVPESLVRIILKAFANAVKDAFTFKKKVMWQKLLKVVICIIDMTFDNDRKQSLELHVQAFKFISLATGEFNKIIYIPGESRQYQNNRKAFIELGGVLLLLILQHNSSEQYIRQESKVMLDRMEIADWENHEKASLPINFVQKLCSFEIDHISCVEERVRNAKIIAQRARQELQKRKEEKKKMEEKEAQEKAMKAMKKKILLQEYMRKKRQVQKVRQTKQLVNIQNKRNHQSLFRNTVRKTRQFSNHSINESDSQPISVTKTCREKMNQEEKYKLQKWIQMKKQQQNERRKLQAQQQSKHKEEQQKRKQQAARKYELLRSKRRMKKIQIQSIQMIKKKSKQKNPFNPKNLIIF